ncbi:hypothetical protein ACH3XW_21030 [Acanthocheilonema viteae]
MLVGSLCALMGVLTIALRCQLSLLTFPIFTLICKIIDILAAQCYRLSESNFMARKLIFKFCSLLIPQNAQSILHLTTDMLFSFVIHALNVKILLVTTHRSVSISSSSFMAIMNFAYFSSKSINLVFNRIELWVPYDTLRFSYAQNEYSELMMI